MKKIFQSIYPSLVWTGIVFWLLTMDTSQSGGVSYLKLIPHYDKLIHLGIFALFSMLWTVFLTGRISGKSINLYLLVVLIGSCYGMGMEFYQLYFTNRSFSWWDGWADAIGTTLGVWWASKKPLWK